MEQEQMEQLKQWLHKYKGILIRVFLYGPGILSAVQIVNLSFQNYVSDYFFWVLHPICADPVRELHRGCHI